MTDTISDLLTRIRNAAHARHSSVEVPASFMKESILKILQKSGFISHYVRQEIKPQDQLKIFLKYDAQNRPCIKKITRVSRPGCRVYKGYRHITPYLRGLGISIISTPKGILTDHEARQLKVGGEVMCQVW